MKKTVLLLFFLVYVFMFVPIVPKAEALNVSARAAVLYDSATGRVLYSKNQDERLPMASTTKIMTCILAIENMDFSSILTVKREHLAEGSSMYLRVGEKISVEALVNGLMLVSGNDAASVLAAYGGRDGKTFVDLMNEKAAELGMTNTHFDNPHGLDSKNHYTTAIDLAKLADYAMKNEIFSSIVSKKSATLEGHGLKNHNKLLWRYEGADGVKTGYTTRAGRCLVSSAERDGFRLIAVTLNAPDDWRDHVKMLNLGFDDYKPVKLINKGDSVYDMPVISGEIPFVYTVAENDVIACLSEDELARVEKKLLLPRFVYAPVAKGETAGSVIYILDNQVIGETELVFESTVLDGYVDTRGFFRRLWDSIIEFFFGL